MTRITLSPQQQAVVDHRGGDLQVIACAGSGKTESISRRIAALIADGAEPESIVAFTFTDRAAAELKERVVRRVAERMGAAFRDRLGPMYVGTIHGYCFRLLQDHVPRYGNFDVLDPNRHAGLLSREYRTLGLSRLGARHWQPIRDFAQTVDVIGNELIDVDALGDTPLAACVRDHRALLERYRLLTFSMIIEAAVEVLDDPLTFARVHDRLRHLIVDEYQDINPAQEALIEKLTAGDVDLCVVGDDDQSIYQWRGSDVRHIVDFTRRRPGSIAITLDANRRSQAQIVQAASTFARSIPGRLDKSMVPVRAAGERAIVPWKADTPDAEATLIADAIARLHAQGRPYRDIAVLYRSVRGSAPPLLDALDQRGIPYRCGGRTGLFLQPEIALLGELFAWFVDGEWQDERYGDRRQADLDRVIKGLSRLFADCDEMPGLRQFFLDWRAFHERRARAVSLVADIYLVYDRLGVSRLDPDDPVQAARLGALARFSEVLADFEHVNRRGLKTHDANGVRFQPGPDRGRPYFRALHNYLLHWARDAYEDYSGDATSAADAVDILTVHQAKGLEWPVVFLPALQKNRFPSSRAGRSKSWMLPETVFPLDVRGRYEGGDAEERRLFYVAMTRARDTLYLSHFERQQRRSPPSPYFTEVAGRRVDAPDELPLPPAPTATRTPTPPPLHVAFSDLARLDACGHAYRLGTVFGFQQPLAPELGYGRAIHHVLRHVAERAHAGNPPDVAAVETLLDDEFYVPFATGPAFQRMHGAARKLVARYIAEHADDLARIWGIERPFELHLDRGVVTGRADVILDREHGRADRLAIVDYKVSDDPLRERQYGLQLQVYTAAARGEGLAVHGAYLHALRESRREPVDVSINAVAGAVMNISRLVDALGDGRFEPKPDLKTCEPCSWRALCAHAVEHGRAC